MTGALARMCANHPIRTIIVWVILIVVALGVVGQYLPSATTTNLRLGSQYESEQGAAALERLRGPERLAEIVVVQSPDLTVDDAAFRAKVDEVHASIAALGPEIVSGGLGGLPLSHYYQVSAAAEGAAVLQAMGITPPLTPDKVQQLMALAEASGQEEQLQSLLADPSAAEQLLGLLASPEQTERLRSLLVSPDKRTVLMHYTMAGTAEEAVDNVAEVLHVVEELNGVDGFRVLIGGSASTAYENNELSEQDLQQGERFGVPVALLVLLLLFGAVVATLLPLGLAIISILVALAVVAAIGQASPLLFFVTVMVVMLGLAVGIDYSLVIVSRFKEEMLHGLSARDAVIRTGDTANRTVLFSGATVVLALLGLLIVPASFYQSLALGAIIVVIATLAATLTLLPAVLTLLGHRVDFLSIGFLKRFSLKSPEENEHGFWDHITRIVTKAPVISILLVGVPMLALASFYLDIRTGLNDVNSYPDKAETKQAFLVFEEEFSFGEVNPAGFLTPAEIVIEGNIGDPAVMGAIERVRAAVIADADFPVPPNPLEVNDAGDVALLSVPYPGKPASPEAAEEMRRLRSDIVAPAFEGVDAEVYVGGLTAEVTDFYDIVRVYTPIVFAFVLGLSFIILMMVFRSIVIPLKAIIMNLLSVGATYGLLVLVFQKGVGIELFGFQRADVIDAWLPLFLFTILFGLSMDYHVFLLSRIRERYDESGNNTEAVAYGLRSTAGLITGAALIMVVVFGAFAAGDTVVNQLMGFGLAVAVLLDATLVRSILVPASMEVLGRGNWYLPKWLNWLPDLRVEGD